MEQRVKGRKQVDKIIEEETGLEIRLYVYSETMRFEAVVEGKSFKGTDGEEVRQKAIDYAKEIVILEWVPVIVVKETVLGYSMQDTSFIGFTLFRYYVTKRKDGKWSKIDWAKYHPDAEIKASQGPLARDRHFEYGFDSLPHVTTRPHRKPTVTVLAYDESTWAGLQSIKENIDKLRDTFFELIGSTAGIEKVTAYGASLLKLLPAGDPE